MIKKITLTQWKSFSSATLHIDPLTVLIGTNASGKSNVVDALLFLQRITSGISLTEAIVGNAIVPPLRGGLEWVALQETSDFTLSVLVGDESNETEFLYTIQAEIADNQCLLLSESVVKKRHHATTEERSIFSGTCQKGENDILVTFGSDVMKYPRRHSIFGQMRVRLDDLKRRGRLYDSDALEDANVVFWHLVEMFILDPIPANMRTYTPLSRTLNPDGSNIAGFMAALPEEKKEEVRQAIDKYLRHLPEGDIVRVWAEEVGRLKSDAMLYCEERWLNGQGAKEIDARSMSDGTLRFLAILIALLIYSKGSLLVIEEVDNGLHPSRADLLVRMLKEIGGRRKVDLLVTTHNPAVLDALGPEMIPCVTIAHRDPQSGHSQLTLLEDVHQLPKLLAMGSVGRLATTGRLEKALAGKNQLPSTKDGE